MDLLLIRHGETTSNVSRAMDTVHPGADLTALGRRQAEELAAHLAGEPIGAVYVSPRRRTRSTARPLLEALGQEPLLRDGLVEISAGDWEMSSDESQRTGYAETVQAWLGGDLEARIPGGEDPADVLARFDAVVEEIVGSGLDRVAVVSHGAVLRAWCGMRVPGIDTPTLREQPLRNTALVRLSGGPGSWRVTEWDAREIATLDPAGESDPGVEESA